jgi:hypothetical protein
LSLRLRKYSGYNSACSNDHFSVHARQVWTHEGIHGRSRRELAPAAQSAVQSFLCGSNGNEAGNCAMAKNVSRQRVFKGSDNVEDKIAEVIAA